MSKEQEQLFRKQVVQVWTGLESAEDVDYSNIIAPFLYHRGSDQYANVELSSCFSIPNIDSSWAFNTLIDFECHREDVLSVIADIKSYSYMGPKSTVQSGRLGPAIMHLVNAKKAKLRMVKEITKYINKGGEVDLQSFLSTEWSDLITSFSGLLIANKTWRVGDWRLKYWYVAATSIKRKKIEIPKTITIKINADNKIRFNLEKFEPVLETNTGLRIKAKFINLISHCLNIPWGFQGIWEWLDLVDRLPIGDWVDEGSEPGDRILKWFSILTKSIIEAKRKIMIQDQKDAVSIANLISVRIVQAAALVAMENKVWEKGLKEAGMPWNREFVIGQMAYSLVAEPDGELAWREWVDRTVKFLGYPNDSGERAFYCFMDLGHPLSHYKFLGIKDYEITESKSVSMEKVNIAMYRFYDLKEGWYKNFTAAIYRDGSIVPSEWKEHGILFITEIDDWIKVFYRTGAFENPTLKISIVPVEGNKHPQITSWKSTMDQLGIKGPYAGLGYKYQIKGRILPVLLSEISKRVYEPENQSAINKVLKGV